MPNATTDDAAKCPPWCPGTTGGRLGRRARGGQRRQWPAQPPSRTRGACLGAGVEPAVTGGTQPTQPWKRPVDLNCCWRALQTCWRQGSLLLACGSASCLRRPLPHCPGSPQASKEARFARGPVLFVSACPVVEPGPPPPSKGQTRLHPFIIHPSSTTQPRPATPAGIDDITSLARKDLPIWHGPGAILSFVA